MILQIRSQTRRDPGWRRRHLFYPHGWINSFEQIEILARMSSIGNNRESFWSTGMPKKRTNGSNLFGQVLVTRIGKNFESDGTVWFDVLPDDSRQQGAI